MVASALARQCGVSVSTFAAAGLHAIAARLPSIIINWVKQAMDALELWVDRGDGKGFVFLAIDSIPDYTDTAAMPPAGQSALWKYKGNLHPSRPARRPVERCCQHSSGRIVFPI